MINGLPVIRYVISSRYNHPGWSHNNILDFSIPFFMRIEKPEDVYNLLKYELFHIVHSAIWHINEKREDENKIIILDKEIWNSIQKIKLGHIKFSLKY